MRAYTIQEVYTTYHRGKKRNQLQTFRPYSFSFRIITDKGWKYRLYFHTIKSGNQWEKPRRVRERESEKEADQMIISAEQDKWLKRSRVCRCAAGDQGEEGGKGPSTPPSTPEIALPAVSQASYWERGNPSAATRRNLAVSQCFCLQFYEQAGSGFSAPETRNISRGTAERASEYSYKFPRLNHLSQQTPSLETWINWFKNVTIYFPCIKVSANLLYDYFWLGWLQLYLHFWRL